MPNLPFFCQTVVVIRSGCYLYMFSFNNNFCINLLMLRQRQEAVCGEKMNFLLRFFSLSLLFIAQKKQKPTHNKNEKNFHGWADQTNFIHCGVSTAMCVTRLTESSACSTMLLFIQSIFLLRLFFFHLKNEVGGEPF